MDRAIADVSKAYKLRVDRIERIEYGLWEESFAVWTDSGRYYAKRFWREERIKKRYDEMLRGLELSQQLRAEGFPAPALVRTGERKPLAHVEDRVYQVNAWVDGRTFHPGELPPEGAFSMGNILGRFHAFFPQHRELERLQLPEPSEAAEKHRNLLPQFKPYHGKFADMARQVLSEQIRILEALPRGFVSEISGKSRSGTRYNSFWVEQMIFNDALEVEALVDWTDGAGRAGYLAEDLDVGLNLSALDEKGVLRFCRGYQQANPLSREEWESVMDIYCYRHLGDTWIFDSWLRRGNRRMEHWEGIAAKWCLSVPDRFHRWKELRDAVVESVS